MATYVMGDSNGEIIGSISCPEIDAPANLANITVILVQPAVPGNIGSSARAMKTMGLRDLVVVNGPRNFATHQQAIMLGHGAGDILEKARTATKVGLFTTDESPPAAVAQALCDGGADLIQLYTGLIFKGPGLPATVLAGLTGRGS